ncbi:hypothetical protein [Umezawaea tangerina]|uniref:Uncharacterized protein n=1 Tax=Umezawaea tangerina TaxID=84725 RepID=A0A2T0TCB8_9PSEU|nr:hypothetical protein [Umezawaea tangerina]PRY43306.1 hypothetical protein CLV43_10346 [Umezawaea tangerina]
MTWNHRDRVTRTRSGGMGTIRLFPDAEPGEATGEVQWDDSAVADELDHVAHDLTRAN